MLITHQNLLIPFICFACLTICNANDDGEMANVNKSEVERYRKIIDKGIQDAFDFVEPKDASQFFTPKCVRKEDNLDVTSYDFIVIGSGAAGSVLTNRLTEIRNASILLIEAGHFENEFVDIPGMSSYAIGTEYNWAYKTIPQNACCLGMVNKQCQMNRGRGVGGTTIINSVVYARGAAYDYNQWNRISAGWAYTDVLPYFIKSEDAEFPEADKNYHGIGGLYNVEISSYTTPHIDAFLLANEELGYKQIDYNGKSHLGVSRIQFNTKNGRRLSAGGAFIQPILSRSNLRLSLDSYVTKIHFTANKRNRKATRVTFVKNGCEYTVKVNKEVILSAGSISSPQILQHSGIGPSKHLAQIGINPLLDLPVGENLQDHIVIKGVSIETNTSIEVKPLDTVIAEYLQGQGPYTLTAVHGAVGFYKLPKSKSHSADVEFVFLTPNRTSGYFQRGNGFSDETTEALTRGIDNPTTMGVLLALEHPKSVGYVRLKSNNPLDYPEIDMKLLEDANGDDIETLYQGILLLEQMLETNAFKSLNAKFKHVDLPACRKFEAFSKDYWYCLIRETSDQFYHPVGSCKMAPRAQNGVVGKRLKVHGVQNLRVADASVIPMSMVGHTSAPSTMIGERCADFIKEDYGLI